MSELFLRGAMLYDQAKYDLAERELRLALSADPQHARCHAMLALCLSQQKRYNDATMEAETAIHQSPEDAYVHFTLAQIMFDRDRYAEATKAIKEAIRLDPDDADYYALLSNIRYMQSRWSAALETAEEGLKIDAEHVVCNNLRAMALVKLGRNDEAGATIDRTMAKDPENAITHANLGWALLHKRDYPKALEHFREALRIDPDLEWARQGIVTALKTRYPIYGWILRYFLWMSKLSNKVQGLVIIGLWFGAKIVRGIIKSNPDLEPWLTPLIVAYLAFVFFSWTADPLFNLFLRMNRFGRLALSRKEIVASNWVGGCVFGILCSLSVYLFTGHPMATLCAIFFGVLVIPISATFACAQGWPRKAMAIYSALLAVAGVAALGLLLLESDIAMIAGGIFFFGAILSSWVANFLMTRMPKR